MSERDTNRVWTEIAKRNPGRAPFIIWEPDDLDLDAVAVEGRVRFKYSTFVSFYESPVYENPTWMDVAVEANNGLLITGDHHHVYFESITRQRSVTIDGEKVLNYHVGMGS